MVAKVPHEQSPSYYDGISGNFCLAGDCKSPEDLRREVEQLRRDELKQREELDSLRGQAQDIIERIEQAERSAREKRKDADFAQKAASDAESRSGKIAALPQAEPKPETTADDPVKLTRDIQAQLQRLKCYRGDIDGVWGDKVEASLKRFADATNSNIPQDEPTRTALTVLSARSDPACSAGDEKDQPAKRVTRPTHRPNPLRYSLSVWGPGSVREGMTVSRNTPHGRLTCVGGNNKTGRPRVCRWN
jgi:hypothetical protein